MTPALPAESGALASPLIFVLPNLVSAVIQIALFVFSLFRRRVPGALQFAGLSLCAALWSASWGLSQTSDRAATKILWFDVAQIGVALAPLFWIALVLAVTGRERWLTPRLFAPLAAIPAVSLALIWLGDAHGWLRRGIEIRTVAGASFVHVDHGPWFTVELAQTYTLIGLCLVLLLRDLPRPPLRRQRLALVAALTLPIASHVADRAGFELLRPFGPASVTFSLSGLVILWALFHERLFDLAPIARSAVVESLGVAVVVADASGRLVDLNLAARMLLADLGGDPAKLPIGRSASAVFRDWERWTSAWTTSLRLGDGRAFEVTSKPIAGRGAKRLGDVVVLHDVTEHERARQHIERQLAEIRRLQDELREQAIRDPLTGCFNRRYLEATLTRELARAERDGSELCLVMIDLDHFKDLNDRFGHAAGDSMLRDVGSLLRGSTRTSDIVCRYGGEEFLVVLVGARRVIGHRRAEQWRQACAEREFVFAGQEVRLTLSAGVAGWRLDAQDRDLLLEAADRALYRAKQKGRNRVEVGVDEGLAEPTPSTPEPSAA